MMLKKRGKAKSWFDDGDGGRPYQWVALCREWEAWPGLFWARDRAAPNC